MDKIQMTVPLVEIDGDEMTRILWQQIKEELLFPFVDLKTKYYDLSLINRDETNDQITIDAAEAIKKYGVGVKCATITANDKRMSEYNLKALWKSPNGTIRSILDGTVFRTPIVINAIMPLISTWKNPITIARHAYGDIYKCVEFRVPGKGKAEILFTGEDGTIFRETLNDFSASGVIQGIFNRDDSIRSFAHSCFQYGVDTHQSVWFAAKDTISKIYDGNFKRIFEEIYENDYRDDYEKCGLTYFYTLFDDALAKLVRSEGGFIFACKNYDGDNMSDLVSSVFGSLAMMTSVLVSPDGCYEFEAAHGTCTDLYYRYCAEGENVINPVAVIFAWSGALAKRGEKDHNTDLINFAKRLENAVLTTLEAGICTPDLAKSYTEKPSQIVNTADFIANVKRIIK